MECHFVGRLAVHRHTMDGMARVAIGSEIYIQLLPPLVTTHGPQ